MSPMAPMGWGGQTRCYVGTRELIRLNQIVKLGAPSKVEDTIYHPSTAVSSLESHKLD